MDYCNGRNNCKEYNSISVRGVGFEEQEITVCQTYEYHQTFIDTTVELWSAFEKEVTEISDLF